MEWVFPLYRWSIFVRRRKQPQLTTWTKWFDIGEDVTFLGRFFAILLLCLH